MLYTAVQMPKSVGAALGFSSPMKMHKAYAANDVIQQQTVAFHRCMQGVKGDSIISSLRG